MNHCARCGWEIIGKPTRAAGTDWHPGCVPTTRRQREAIAWLESVGKASAKLARKHGFAQRTLDALADDGLIRREYMPRTVGGPFPVYRPFERSPVTQSLPSELSPAKARESGWSTR